MSDSSSKTLEIQPVKIDDDKFNKQELEPFVFPSLTIVLGAVAAGKTTFLHNFVRITEPVFHGNVILFSPTLKNDPILDKMVDDDDILSFFENYSNGTLQRVLEAIRDGDENEKYLIIFDDILGSLPRTGSKEAEWFDKFISTYRHGGGIAGEGQISLVFCIQKWTKLTPTLRVNGSYYVLLGEFGEKTKKNLAEELYPATGTSEADFYEKWNEAHQKPYDFLTLDFRKMKAYRNLTDKIYEKNSD